MPPGKDLAASPSHWERHKGCLEVEERRRESTACFLASIAPLILGKKRVVNTEIQGVACSSAPSSTHHLRHGSRVKHNALHLLTLHNSRVHLLWLYYQTTRMQLPKHITEGFHLYNEYIGVKNNPMYIFFLSIWTPCLVPLFIMLPAEY